MVSVADWKGQRAESVNRKIEQIVITQYEQERIQTDKKMNRSSVTLWGYNKRSMTHVTRVLKGEKKESVAEQQLEKIMT